MSTISNEEQTATGHSVLSRMAPVVRAISTLDPKRLRFSDFIDLSGRRKPCVILDSVGSYEMRYLWHQKRHEPFPPDTRGFLYYHLPPNLPPTCGQVRFRITSTCDPAAFESGTDLVSLDTTPWAISTFSLMYPAYDILRKKLLRDRLITPGFVKSMKNLQKKYGTSKTSPRELYYLEQPFAVDTSMRGISARLVTLSQVHDMKLFSIFTDHRWDSQTSPYKGQLLLRFERSALPEHHGTRTVVLRVLKVLNPIIPRIPRYDGYIPRPKLGALILHRRFSKVFVRSWNLDKDGFVSSALKILPSNSVDSVDQLALPAEVP